MPADQLSGIQIISQERRVEVLHFRCRCTAQRVEAIGQDPAVALAMAHRILAMFRVLKSYTVGAAAQHSESKASGMIPFAMATAHGVLEMPCSLKSYTFTAMAQHSACTFAAAARHSESKTSGMTLVVVAMVYGALAMSTRRLPAPLLPLPGIASRRPLA